MGGLPRLNSLGFGPSGLDSPALGPPGARQGRRSSVWGLRCPFWSPVSVLGLRFPFWFPGSVLVSRGGRPKASAACRRSRRGTLSCVILQSSPPHSHSSRAGGGGGESGRSGRRFRPLLPDSVSRWAAAGGLAKETGESEEFRTSLTPRTSEVMGGGEEPLGRRAGKPCGHRQGRRGACEGDGWE